MKYIKGFTLIELMIVIAIIAILVAIAIPIYSDYSCSARAVSIMSAAHNWTTKLSIPV